MADDIVDQITRLQAELAELPEPVAYIVLDPNWSPSLPHVDGHDAQGKRYILCSPALLDGAKHRKWGGISIVSDPVDVVSRLSAIPLYRRQDMPEGWPDR